MARNGGSTRSMVGLFMLRTEGPPPTGGPVYARIEGELYALVFSDSQRAHGARATLGCDGARPFYVCAANSAAVARELRDAGVRGFILDYDPSSATFSSAGAIPS
jgi:hypothetical protein